MPRLKALLRYHPSVDPESFKTARCLLRMSVGQDVRGGEALDLKWVLTQYPDLLYPIALPFKHRKPFKAQCMET